MAIPATEPAHRLDELTTFRLGGRPTHYLRPRGYGELAAALHQLRRDGTPWRVLGGGSNVLAEDGRLSFAVIHICSPRFRWMRWQDETTLQVGAGMRLPALLARCAGRGAGGLEFLAGIPGTLGGAIAGNAGAWDHEIAEAITSVGVAEPDGTFRTLDADELDWQYRGLDLGRRVIVEATLDLQKRSASLVKERIRSLKKEKISRHPVTQNSAGCIFKNPPDESAGRLIDECGLKGQEMGGARVSERHANFIVNTGNASPSDVIALMQKVKREVKEQFGVELETEVQRWHAAPRVA
ncbi:MAG: UDP-N-acetylmuramate dehydrogenase [Planctomycetota bacterium]